MQRYANDDGVVMTPPLGDTRLMSPVERERWGGLGFDFRSRSIL